MTGSPFTAAKQNRAGHGFGRHKRPGRHFGCTGRRQTSARPGRGHGETAGRLCRIRPFCRAPTPLSGYPRTGRAPISQPHCTRPLQRGQAGNHRHGAGTSNPTTRRRERPAHRQETNGRRIMFIGHQNVDEFRWGRLIFQVLSDHCLKIEVLANFGRACLLSAFVNTTLTHDSPLPFAGIRLSDHRDPAADLCHRRPRKLTHQGLDLRLNLG